MGAFFGPPNIVGVLAGALGTDVRGYLYLEKQRFPVWLKYVPEISFRTDNAPFKAAMQGFTTKIVNLMKSESLYESQENEYGPLSLKLGNTGYQYYVHSLICIRPVQDLAFAVANFIQKGDSFVNYYMYHGGTNFGCYVRGPFITTSYDYDAPLDEYGLIRQPKYGHMKGLHKVVKKCEKALVSADPIVTSLGPLQQVLYLPSWGFTYTVGYF
ncbi:hypothetical protein OROHE_014494 [Orobanche hederae]